MIRAILFALGGLAVGVLVTVLAFRSSFDAGFQRGFVHGLERLDDASRKCIEGNQGRQQSADCIVQARIFMSEGSRRAQGLAPEFPGCELSTMRCREQTAEACSADLKRRVASWQPLQDCKASRERCTMTNEPNGAQRAKCVAAAN